MTPDELQALIDDATYDYVTGDTARALGTPGNSGAPGERAHALRKSDPLVIATLSRTWMERGDKARAEQYGALARVQGWKEELSAPPQPDAGGLR